MQKRRVPDRTLRFLNPTEKGLQRCLHILYHNAQNLQQSTSALFCITIRKLGFSHGKSARLTK